MIKQTTLEHVKRYGEIYAGAFSGPPWNDPWKPENAEIHVREILESKQSYGLEYVVDGQVVNIPSYSVKPGHAFPLRTDF